MADSAYMVELKGRRNDSVYFLVQPSVNECCFTIPEVHDPISLGLRSSPQPAAVWTGLRMNVLPDANMWRRKHKTTITQGLNAVLIAERT